MTLPLGLVLCVSLLVLCLAWHRRARSPLFESLVLAPRDWITATDELFWSSNWQRRSLVGTVWHKASLHLPPETTSILPKQVFVNESSVLLFHPILHPWRPGEPLLRLRLETHLDRGADPEGLENFINDRPGGREYAFVQLTDQTFEARPDDLSLTHFSAELLATSFEVAGPLRQRHPLDVPNPAFTWAISAKDSGFHELLVLFRLESSDSSRSVTIGSLTHTIKAVVFGPLTKRQLNITMVFSGVAAIATVVQLLRSLGLLR